MASLIAINQNAFTTAIGTGRHDLRCWQFVPWIAGLALLVLIVTSVVPRITEYR